MTVLDTPLPSLAPTYVEAFTSQAESSIAEASPTLADRLFRSTALAPVWLVVRLWLGYEWLTAGWEKLGATGRGSWFGHAPALAGFVKGADATWAARANAHGHPGVHYAWFLNFLHFVADHGAVFGPLIVISELLIGLGLMTGVLTRWAALAAIALNVMYITGGSPGVNGIFVVAAVLLMAAWRVAGHLGGDRIIPVRLGGARHAV
jgi:thiosulfate dehydrogenase [quinone] large subunit